MTREYRSSDFSEYRMNYRDPHRQLEPLHREIAVVDEALAALEDAGAAADNNRACCFAASPGDARAV